MAEALIGRGVELLPFECRASDGARRPQSELREELARRLRHRRPTLVHANSLAMGRLSGPVAADLGIASVGHLRDIVNMSGQALADLNRHSRLLAVSHAPCGISRCGGSDGGEVHVVYNGVDLDEFCPRSPSGYLHRELGLPPEVALVGTIGQIGLRKGHDVLLRAAARSPARLPNVHYLIVGQRHSEKTNRGSSSATCTRLRADRWPDGCIFSGFATTLPAAERTDAVGASGPARAAGTSAVGGGGGGTGRRRHGVAARRRFFRPTRMRLGWSRPTTPLALARPLGVARGYGVATTTGAGCPPRAENCIRYSRLRSRAVAALRSSLACNGARHRANHRASEPGQSQKRRQQPIAVVGQNRLRVKLQAHHRQRPMLDGHDRAVVGAGGDFQAVGQRGLVDHQRVIATADQRIGQPRNRPRPL